MIDQKSGVPPAAPRNERNNGTGSEGLIPVPGTRPRMAGRMIAVLVGLALIVGLVGGRVLFGGGGHSAGATVPTSTVDTSIAPTSTTASTIDGSDGGFVGGPQPTDSTTTTEAPPSSEQPTTTAPPPRQLIGASLLTPGAGFDYRDDWVVQGKNVATAGQESGHNSGSDTGELGIAVPPGASHLTGKLVIGDNTETPDVSVDVTLLVDGKETQKGTLTLGQAFAIDLNVTGRRRLDLATKISRGGGDANADSDVNVVFVDGVVQ